MVAISAIYSLFSGAYKNHDTAFIYSIAILISANQPQRQVGGESENMHLEVEIDVRVRGLLTCLRRRWVDPE